MQYLGDKELTKSSILYKRKDIVAPEVRLYLAAFIYRGMLCKPKEHVYHCKNKLFAAPGFRLIISQNELVLLEKFLHFVDDEELGYSYNKAVKIQPILDKLVEQFKLLLELERNVSFGESRLLWKGCLSWKQYIPKKDHFSLKAFMLSKDLFASF